MRKILYLINSDKVDYIKLIPMIHNLRSLSESQGDSRSRRGNQRRQSKLDKFFEVSQGTRAKRSPALYLRQVPRPG